MRIVNESEELLIFLSRKDGDYKVCNVDVVAEFKLVNHDAVAKTVNYMVIFYPLHYFSYLNAFIQIENPFPKNQPEWGKRFGKWSEIGDAGKVSEFSGDRDIVAFQGFVKDSKITVLVEFSLWKVIGYR